MEGARHARIGWEGDTKTNRGVTPNDPKLSDGGGRRSLCGKAAGAGLRVGAQAVTPGAVRCSAWLGVSFIAERREKKVLENCEAGDDASIRNCDAGRETQCRSGAAQETKLLRRRLPRTLVSRQARMTYRW